MSTIDIINSVAYLRSSREFPEDLHLLSVQVNKSYIDIANAVNNRTIGIFPINRAANNGEAWYITQGKKQQGFRQVYVFNTTADINIGFKITSVSRFVHAYGQYVDAVGNSYGLINGTSVPIAGQISFFVFKNVANPKTDLVRFEVGALAPPLIGGTIVLEWISEP